MRSLSITGHWNVSLPSGVSPWNSIFGLGRRSKYNMKTDYHIEPELLLTIPNCVIFKTLLSTSSASQPGMLNQKLLKASALNGCSHRLQVGSLSGPHWLQLTFWQVGISIYYFLTLTNSVIASACLHWCVTDEWLGQQSICNTPPLLLFKMSTSGKFSSCLPLSPSIPTFYK